METPPLLNPAQQRVIDALGRGGERVALPDDFGERLRVGLTDGLTEIAGHLDAADPVWISKHALATIHTCEAHHQAMSVDFAWTVPTARGSVAHKAIELAVHWKGAPLPGDLVDEALARLVDQDDGLGRFVAGLGPGDVAELRAIAIDRVSKFQECFPPLKPAWVPVTESKARVELFDGALVLAAKTDLTLGRPGEKVIVDFKSGRVHAHHGDDLRYYALIETIRIAAPRKLASYELDSARLLVEEVRDTTLYAALRRTIDGVTAIVELRAGREPRKRAGPACRWCPVLAECAEGQADRARSADLATGDLSPEDW